MEEIEELRAKVIASMSNPSSAVAKVKSPPGDAELASTRWPPNPSSTSSAAKSTDSDVELAANPTYAAAMDDAELASSKPSSAAAAAANAKSPSSDLGSANPSPSAVNVAELASMPSSSPVEIKSTGSGDLGELVSIPASAGKVKSPALREEGELSSASGEEVPEVPACSTVPSSHKTVDEPVVIAPRDKASQSMKAANNFVGRGSCRTNIQLPVPIKKNYSKILKVKQGPFKSRNSRTISWNGKGSDDNLVIRFSNDDSESDSEDSNLGENVRTKTNNEATLDMPVTSRPHQKVLRRPPTNRTKPVQNKSVSFTAYGRGSSYGKPVSSACEVDPRIRRHTSVTKPSPTQEHEHVQIANFTDRKLESLRHQIAIKENALQVHNNSMIQSEERLAGSFGDHQVVGMRRPFVTANVVAPIEQPMKRLKLDVHPQSTFSDGQLRKATPSPRFISEFYKDSHPVDCREGEGNAVVITDTISDRRCKEANRDNGIPSYALLNGTKDDEPLVLTSSRTMRYIDVPPESNYTFAAEVSSGSRQFGLGANPGDLPEVQNETFSPTQMEGIANDGAICQFVAPTGGNLSSESPRPSNTGVGGGVLLGTSNQIFGKQVVHVRDPQLSDDDVNMSASMDLESLLKLEEQQDDELEQAQELRRRCEFEERRAMKAYRDAQRALIKANEKCSQLYRKREVFSAQLRALTMEASSSWCPSDWQNPKGTVEVSPKTALTSVFGSTVVSQMLAGQVLDCSGCDYNDHCPDGAYQQTRGLVSDQRLEPEATRSAPTVANAICTTANHSNMSADEDDVNFPFVRKSVKSRSTGDVNGGNYEGNPTNMNVGGDISPSGEMVRDYELLEATLRSKLVARLSARMPSTICDVSNTEYNVDEREDTTGEKTTSSLIGQRLVEREDLLTLETEGFQRPGRSYSQLITHFPDESRGNTLCLTDELHRNVDRAEDISSLPSSNLQIISRHAEFILPGSCNGSSTTTEKGYRWSTAEDVSDCVLDFAESKEYSSRPSNTGDMDFSVCDDTIDPFRPFCLFELRGKCNNEECPWQHVRNSTNRTKKCSIHHVTTSSDDWFNPSLSCGNRNAHCPCHQNMQVPTYILGSDLINIDSSLPGPLLARSNLRYWQRGLCGSFPLPFSVERILPSDALFLQSDDALVADDYCRNRHFLRFRSQVDPMEQFKEGLPVTEQSLETALDLCDGENVYKPKMKKALALISRALEKDPTSVVSWVVYLHIYYGNEKEIGKEDLFLDAVQKNGGSYDLWLIYINSRERLADRLQAYDFALTSFCEWKDTCDKDDTYTSDKDDTHTSACILDIFLQMVDFLCMSGNVKKAVSGFYQLLHTTQFENSGDTLCSRVHSHLTVSDKCIFWFCCIYVVIYGKLPEPVVQKFEFEKDPSYDIEWPYVLVPVDRKDMALELMKVCVNSMALDTDIDSHRRDQNVVRSLHFLVICHIRSVGVLEGLRVSTDLLVKYLKLYPSCIELVLMSARLESSVGDDVFKGFEEALINWPMGTRGRHCIWNQYAQHVLENKGSESAEKLMSHWFQCYFNGKDSCTKNMGGVEDMPGYPSGLPSVVQSDGSSGSLIADDTFKFLNLSLYRRLQKNLSEARLAIDKALELAAPSEYEHCVREHAAFIFSNESELQRVSHGFICSLLNDHLGGSRASSSETLSRRYYRSIKRPRIRKFIDNILGSLSRDCSRMNSILEACYGSSLIPEKFGRTEDLVDLVEVLMERMPENYQVALSACRYTWRNFSRTGIRFWAISIFVNSILRTAPVAPEHVWLEAANFIRNLDYSSCISTRFHQQALSVYPFSVKLWQSYLDLSRITGDTDAVVAAARQRGLELVESVD